MYGQKPRNSEIQGRSLNIHSPCLYKALSFPAAETRRQASQTFIYNIQTHYISLYQLVRTNLKWAPQHLRFFNRNQSWLGIQQQQLIIQSRNTPSQQLLNNSISPTPSFNNKTSRFEMDDQGFSSTTGTRLQTKTVRIISKSNAAATNQCIILWKRSFLPRHARYIPA